jgi:Concanavalin A-like lectin/glucanases superfamily
MVRGILHACAVIMIVLGLAPFARSALLFSSNTDTISIAGNTIVSDRATYEAVITLSSTTNSQNQACIFNDWQYGYEDEQFDIRNGAFSAYSYPLDNSVITGPSLTTGVLYDLAYVYDGSQERLYVNGNLVASRAATGFISTGSPNTAAVGAINRDGGIVYSFLGTLQSLRISNTARYSGNSYTPTYGDFTDDTSTLLLYDFDSAPVNGVVPDLSNTGHTGTLGGGFIGSTAPTFVTVPEPAGPAVMGLVLAGLLMRRRCRVSSLPPVFARPQD